MKKISLCLLLLLFIVGCDAGDLMKTYKSVEREFPNAEIRRIGGRSYQFIIKNNDGTIWYAETNNFTNPDISFMEKEF
jgi:hypothetical protein